MTCSSGIGSTRHPVVVHGPTADELWICLSGAAGPLVGAPLSPDVPH